VIFKRDYKILLLGVVWQYVHSVATNLAYYLHTQRTPLNDLGFNVIPALSSQLTVISEVLFFIFLTSTILFVLSPFFTNVHPQPTHTHPSTPTLKSSNGKTHCSGCSKLLTSPPSHQAVGDRTVVVTRSPLAATHRASRKQQLSDKNGLSVSGKLISPDLQHKGQQQQQSTSDQLKRVASCKDFVTLPPSNNHRRRPQPLSRKQPPRLYTSLMLVRFFRVLVLAQTLRIISFLVTSLPGPNYHCRPGSTRYSPPKGFSDMILRQDAFFGCGDLVFSSHTTFLVLCALTIHKYCSIAKAKVIAWVFVSCFCVLCISARKHYSLDVIVALYTVPLLWTAVEMYFPDQVPNFTGSQFRSNAVASNLNAIQKPFSSH